MDISDAKLHPKWKKIVQNAVKFYKRIKMPIVAGQSHDLLIKDLQFSSFEPFCEICVRLELTTDPLKSHLVSFLFQKQVSHDEQSLQAQSIHANNLNFGIICNPKNNIKLGAVCEKQIEHMILELMKRGSENLDLTKVKDVFKHCAANCNMSHEFHSLKDFSTRTVLRFVVRTRNPLMIWQCLKFPYRTKEHQAVTDEIERREAFLTAKMIDTVNFIYLSCFIPC